MSKVLLMTIQPDHRRGAQPTSGAAAHQKGESVLKGCYRWKGNVRTAPVYAACGLGVVHRQTRGLRTKEPFWYLCSRSCLPWSKMNFATTIVGSILLSIASTPLVTSTMWAS